MKDDTKGSIYYILCEYYYSQPPLIKIGFTSGDPISRLDTVQSHCPFDLKLIQVLTPAYLIQERWLHYTFSELRKRGEWFQVSLFFSVEDILKIKPPSLYECKTLYIPRFKKAVNRLEVEALTNLKGFLQ